MCNVPKGDRYHFLSRLLCPCSRKLHAAMKAASWPVPTNCTRIGFRDSGFYLPPFSSAGHVPLRNCLAHLWCCYGSAQGLHQRAWVLSAWGLLSSFAALFWFVGWLLCCCFGWLGGFFFLGCVASFWRLVSHLVERPTRTAYCATDVVKRRPLKKQKLRGCHHLSPYWVPQAAVA